MDKPQPNHRFMNTKNLNSTEIEQAVISCLLQSPSENLPSFLIRYRDAGEMFQEGMLGAIYEAMVALSDTGAPVEPVSVWNTLRNDTRWMAWKGIQWNLISGLLDVPVVPSALEYYAEKLEEAHIKRKIFELSLQIEDHLRDETSSQCLAWLETEVLNIVKNRESAPEQVPISTIVRDCLDLFEAAFESKGAIQGVPSGIRLLDKITNGFKPGQLIILAGRPGMGKTSLAMNMVEHAAVDCGMPVGVFSVEMSKEQLIQRAMCSLSRENFDSLQAGTASETSINRLGAQSQRISKSPLFIQDPSGININQLCARARRMKRKANIHFLMIDYIGLINGDGKSENRAREVTQVTNALKCLAKELRIPILALAQLNRKVEDAGGREPRLSDLRESGSIEQDADVVMLLNSNEPKPDEQPTDLIVAKHRGGRTAKIALMFVKKFTRFEEVCPTKGVTP